MVKAVHIGHNMCSFIPGNLHIQPLFIPCTALTGRPSKRKTQCCLWRRSSVYVLPR